MQEMFVLKDFLREYSTNEQCLEKIKNVRFPQGITCSKCNQITKHYKIKGRLQYACSICGTHIAPLAGTVFEKSTTPLTSWFYAMFVMTKTRSGVSAKQIQRELGVTYKTAWRMCKHLRILMADTDFTPLEGTVEVDETFIGGKGKNKRYEPHFNLKSKEIVIGMIKRGGKAYFKHIPDTGRLTLVTQINEYISPKARVITDQHPGYAKLGQTGFNHFAVNHNVSYLTQDDIHTQNAENMWSNLKRGLYGVYRHVSKKYLQAYVDEYSFRYNNRNSSEKMFETLLSQVSLISSVGIVR